MNNDSNSRSKIGNNTKENFLACSKILEESKEEQEKKSSKYSPQAFKRTNMVESIYTDPKQ